MKVDKNDQRVIFIIFRITVQIHASDQSLQASARSRRRLLTEYFLLPAGVARLLQWQYSAPILTMLLQLLASVVLALPVAWDREQEGPSMGLRTFPLGSCAYVLTGLGLVSPDDHVRGTASAASIWMIGALGAAVGFQRWPLAIRLCGRLSSDRSLRAGLIGTTGANLSGYAIH